jgi:hypothetical protein
MLSLVVLYAGCASSAVEEQPPAAAATEGAEAPATPPPATPAPAPAAPEAAAPATPAAQVAQPPAPVMPTAAGIIIHEVKDFDAWKALFDGHRDARIAAGMLGEGVMRGVDNDKLVAVYLPTTDPAKATAFFADKGLKDKMKEAGVKGKPTTYAFNTRGGKMAHHEGPLAGAIMQLNVKDFAAFKTAIEGQDAALTAAGIAGYGLGQDAEKETVAYLYLQSEDLTMLKAYLAAKETKTALKDAGVKGQPKTTVVQEASMAMY